ncbi:hypothetical protein ScPMuIL_014662 [Solemya velum]
MDTEPERRTPKELNCNSFGRTSLSGLCRAYGFLLLFGLHDVVCGLLTSSVALLCVQNPGSSTRLSKLHRTLLLLTVTPQKVVIVTLCLLTVFDTPLFDASSPFSIACFPVRRADETGTALSILIFCLLWLLLCLTVVCSIINLLKLRKANRVFSSSSNIWQSQFSGQGKVLQKFLLVDEVLVLIVIIIITYYGFQFVDDSSTPTWVTMVSLGLTTVLHGTVSNFGNIMWNSCCCRANQKVEEPHRKLKKLELVKIEAPGKLRMRAIWSTNHNTTKRGLMKVYGTDHLRAWAQEIVVLGMLRKAQHPSLLKCLWTNSANPYYETMTLITGEVVTCDSRIICLEMTNSGTLNEFLNQVNGPLPESLQRVVVHDIAEGLSYLHNLNILHSRLTTSSVYLKGSLPSTVLRAAIGDFEDAQVYGSLQQSTDVNIRDKRHFFLPDIRSFALIALEVISRMCEKKLRYRHFEMEPENAPLMMYLSNMISDSYDGEFMDGCDGSFDLEEYTPVTQRKDFSKNNDFDPESICDELAKSMRSPGFATAQKIKKSESSRHKHKPHKQNESQCVEDEDFVIQPDRTYSQASDLGKSHSKKCDRSGSNISLTSRQAFEAFPVQSSSHKTKEVKKSESLRWLSKPGSILKSITGTDTTVSVFKAPSPDEHAHKHNITHESIVEEEIETMASPMKRKGRKHKKREIDEFRSPHQQSETMTSFPVHSPRRNPRDVIECVVIDNSDVESRSHTLERKKSEDSKSAVWPPAPSPDIDIPAEPRDELGEILECLPGMAELEEVRRSTPSILELLSAKESEKPLPYRSRFELVDYYAELGRNHQSNYKPSSREMINRVVCPTERNARSRSADDIDDTDHGGHSAPRDSENGVERRVIQTPALVENKPKRAHPRHTRPRSHDRTSHENSREITNDNTVDESKPLTSKTNGKSKRSHSSIGSVSATVRATDDQVNKRNRAQSALKRKTQPARYQHSSKKTRNTRHC